MIILNAFTSQGPWSGEWGNCFFNTGLYKVLLSDNFIIVDKKFNLRATHVNAMRHALKTLLFQNCERITGENVFSFKTA